MKNFNFNKLKTNSTFINLAVVFAIFVVIARVSDAVLLRMVSLAEILPLV